MSENPTTALLELLAEFFAQDVRSFDVFNASREHLFQHIAAARIGLEEQMMALVAQSRKEPRLPVKIQMKRRTRTGETSTYLEWQSNVKSLNHLGPVRLMQHESAAQKAKFNEWSVRMAQLTQHHAVLKYIKSALMHYQSSHSSHLPVQLPVDAAEPERVT